MILPAPQVAQHVDPCPLPPGTRRAVTLAAARPVPLAGTRSGGLQSRAGGPASRGALLTARAVHRSPHPAAR
jgi:hypothetical protein